MKDSIIKLYLSGLSQQKVANKLGCSRSTVEYWLKRSGIRIRSRKESMPRGVEHHNFKGDGIKNSWYKILTIDGRRISEHRLVMEKHLGRKLLPSESIHHINEVKTDNRIDNLRLVTHQEHMVIHKKKETGIRICKYCKKTYERVPRRNIKTFEKSKFCSLRCRILNQRQTS